jgi:hypothetical protein
VVIIAENMGGEWFSAEDHAITETKFKFKYIHIAKFCYLGTIKVEKVRFATLNVFIITIFENKDNYMLS